MASKMSDSLDYTVDSFEDRLGVVEKIVQENDSMLVDFYSDHYNPHINQTGLLSEETRTSKDLEALASYLLYSKDSEAQEDTITDYKKKRNTTREAPIENLLKVKESKTEGKKAIAKVQKIKVSKEDREEFFELHQTGIAISNLTKMIKTKQDSNGNLLSDKEVRKLKWIRTDIQKDEIAIKNELKGYIRFNTITKAEKDMIALSYIRYDDVETIRTMVECYEELKQLSKNDTHGYLKVIMIDFDNLIKETPFEDYMKEIFLLKVQNTKYDEMIEIIKDKYDVDLTKTRLSKITREIIPSMIVETYNKLKEEWVFTEMLRGKYKTCSDCKTNYLASNKYFNQDKMSKDGLRSVCKKCRRKKYKSKNAKSE